MATITKGKTFVSGETVTPTKLHELVDNATATNIVNADISTGAAIAYSKLNLSNSITSGDITSSAVTQPKLASGVAGTGPAFRAYASGTTSVPQNTNTRVTLSAEDFDTANCFSSSRFTPNVAGYYQFNYTIRMENVAAMQANLYKNGAVVSVGSLSNSAGFGSSGSDLVYMNGTTDYVELFAYHNDAGSKNVAASSGGTFLAGFLAIKA